MPENIRRFNRTKALSDVADLTFRNYDRRATVSAVQVPTNFVVFGDTDQRGEANDYLVEITGVLRRIPKVEFEATYRAR